MTSFTSFVLGLQGRVPDLGRHPLDFVLAKRPFDMVPARGVMVECGVFTGRSITKIANAYPNRKIYGLDSFEGLPEAWARPDIHFEKGAFSLAGGALPPVPGNVQLIAGWFDATLPVLAADLAARGEKVALLHVDCDLYSSTKTVFDTLGPLLDDRCVIVFDELLNYPTYEQHEVKAFHEFLEASGRGHVWIGKHGKVDIAPQQDQGYWDQPVAVVLTPDRR